MHWAMSWKSSINLLNLTQNFLYWYYLISVWYGCNVKEIIWILWQIWHVALILLLSWKKYWVVIGTYIYVCHIHNPVFSFWKEIQNHLGGSYAYWTASSWYLNKGWPTRWHLLYYILLNMFQTFSGSAYTWIPHHQQTIPLHNTSTPQVSLHNTTSTR